MDSLYACLFSNGHVKVGRSIDPTSRIAAHAERVACLGVLLVESVAFPCVGPVVASECALIDKCAEVATQRNGNEWFTGLDFGDVAVWARQCADAVAQPPAAQIGGWAEYVRQVQARGHKQCDIAARIGCARPSIANVANGRTVDPSFSVGYGLLLIGREAGLPDPAFIGARRTPAEA